MSSDEEDELQIIFRGLANHLKSKNGKEIKLQYNFDDVFDNLEARIFKIISFKNKEKTEYDEELSYDFATSSYTTTGIDKSFIKLIGENVKISYKIEEIKELLKFIYHFKDNFKYSKICDSFIHNDEFEYYEDIEYGKFLLGHVHDECCICYDLNSVKTVCGHNLCRICFKLNFKKCIEINCEYCEQDIENISVTCPLCRECLGHF